MTDNEQSRSIDTDTLFGHLMDQTAGVVEVDRESLAGRKEQLLHMLGEPADGASALWEDTPVPPPPSRPARQRPLNEVAFLTVAEVASVMRVSKMTVYRLVHSGHLPAIRVGRAFRVPEQAVHEYLRESYLGVEVGGERPSDGA
jgi:excisionase family DNA binding protein